MTGKLSKVFASDAMIGAVLTLFFLIGYVQDWKILRVIDYRLYDLRAQLRQDSKPSDQILIVGVDDDSIAKIGRWPWPRSVIARLIETLSASGAKVIGVGFLFSEPERSEGIAELKKLREKITIEAKAAGKPGGEHLREVYSAIERDLTAAEERLDHDKKLAAAIAQSPQVVLPMFFEIGKPLGREAEEPAGPIVRNAVDEIDNPAELEVFRLTEARKLTPPLPAFLGERPAIGHINVRADEDGVVRKELLFVDYQNHFYPSFALRAVMAFLNLQPKDIRVTLGSHATAGTIRIPTDTLMRMRISFISMGAFRTVSAHELLSGKVPADMIRGKMVLLGPLATGLADRNVTPVSPAIPGVELIANVAENVLKQNFISVPSWAPAVELSMFVLVGVFLIVGIPRLAAGPAGLATAVLLVLYLGATIYFFVTDGYVITALHPILLLVTGYTIMTSKRFLVTEKRKVLVEADSIETNKTLGLSFQGQGMLDMAFEKFRKCPLDEAMKELLYNLSLDFERKRMFNKAVAVYEHISTKDKRFKDIEERMKRLRAVGETMIFGTGGFKKASADGTLLMDHAGEKPTLGRYEVAKELGRGAMGIVYLGKDPKIQRAVAIKTIRLDEVDPEQVAEVKARFFREAESAGRLSHPNIVTIFDAGEEQELGYIAMEVLDGSDLKEWCRKDNLFPVRQVLENVAKVAEALDYAHVQGIVHRDIKPANIMILKDGTIKVTDFGIARITASSKTQTGVVLGTPSYMSPEQVKGAKVDGRSDLFSLGVVCYELLTGVKPFQGDSVATLMYQITSQPHESPLTMRGDLPPCCQAIIDRALQKEVDKRYQRGTEMAQELRACLQTIAI